MAVDLICSLHIRPSLVSNKPEIGLFPGSNCEGGTRSATPILCWWDELLFVEVFIYSH